MRLPIKLNLDGFPEALRHQLHGKHDPRRLLQAQAQQAQFEQSITGVNIDGTWKRTNKNRQPQTDHLLAQAIQGKAAPVLLEVGASAGMTSVELAQRLGAGFGKFYVTDLYFSMPCAEQGQTVFFYHPVDRRCIMSANDRFIAYEDVAGAMFPLGMLAKRWLKKAPSFNENWPRVDLRHPEFRSLLAQDPRLVVQEHDIFKPWLGEKLDAIKVANILNRSYFSDLQLKQALAHLLDALRPQGVIVIADNRRPPGETEQRLEKASVFRKVQDQQLQLEQEINGGTEIRDLLLGG
jgi:predicted O-methyltransferase YrrM